MGKEMKEVRASHEDVQEENVLGEGKRSEGEVGLMMDSHLLC